MAKIISKKTKAMNRHWKNFVDKNYLGSHNLEEGEEMLLTVDRFVGEETVETADGKKVKQVLYFKEQVPKMILNITNGNVMSMLYGSHPDQWPGKQIQVYAAKVNAFGKQQEAIRIRDFKPKTAGMYATQIALLNTATSLPELAVIWKKFPLSVQSDKEVTGAKEALKAKLATEAMGSDQQQ